MATKLTLEDRYYLSMYSRRLPCTLQLRFAIDAFLDQIEITPEELKNHGVKINGETMEFECKNPEVETEYEDFPEPVKSSMRSYIKMLDHDKNNKNVMLAKTFEYFRKIL